VRLRAVPGLHAADPEGVRQEGPHDPGHLPLQLRHYRPAHRQIPDGGQPDGHRGRAYRRRGAGFQYAGRDHAGGVQLQQDQAGAAGAGYLEKPADSGLRRGHPGAAGQAEAAALRRERAGGHGRRHLAAAAVSAGRVLPVRRHTPLLRGSCEGVHRQAAGHPGHIPHRGILSGLQGRGFRGAHRCVRFGHGGVFLHHGPADGRRRGAGWGHRGGHQRRLLVHPVRLGVFVQEPGRFLSTYTIK